MNVEVADPDAGYSETQRPARDRHKVIVGVSGGKYGIRGFVRASTRSRASRSGRRTPTFQDKLVRQVGRADVGRRPLNSTANPAGEKAAFGQVRRCLAARRPGVWMNPGL